MNKRPKHFVCRYGFSLAEVLLAVTIGSMVLVAVVTVYNRVQSCAAAISENLQREGLTNEILQRIAEDLDKVISTGAQTRITVENKHEKGLATARLTINKTIYDDKNKKQTFEQVIWQTDYDPDTESLILYRSHSGIVTEDKLLDSQKEDWETEVFVPICSGITFFRVQARRKDDFRTHWDQRMLPDAIVVIISFAPPHKTIQGTLEVRDSEKTTRTMAVDRTRKLRFKITPPEQSNYVKDANDVTTKQQ